MRFYAKRCEKMRSHRISHRIKNFSDPSHRIAYRIQKKSVCAHLWKPFADRYVRLWYDYIKQWLKHGRGTIYFECFDDFISEPLSTLNRLYNHIGIHK